MFKVSVYGKGGIGKSTISANLSYGLSRTGKRILHVGCDPKHDSTRLLVGGEPIPTYAEKPTDPIIDAGNGISCLECGGAECGTGCAGKGMGLMFDSISDIEADYRICDVLGDVVCGGFSIPLRKGNVDAVILVTSGEFMSLYALNNLLRGIRNINDTACILGIVFNRRGDEGEEVPVRRFSEAVGLPILCDIPRSSLFKEAEGSGRTLLESYPDSDEAVEIRRIINAIESRSELHHASPLPERSMMDLAAGRPIVDRNDSRREGRCTFEMVDHERNMTYTGNQVMPSCSSHGGVDAALRITDAATVIHGPLNCAYLMEFAFRRRMMQSSATRGGLLPPCNIYSTALDGNTAFSGDVALVEDAVRRAVSDGFRHVFIVPTCSSEIIATDLVGVASRLSSEMGADIVAVPGDENFLGSKFGEINGVMDILIWRMEPCMSRREGAVNLVSRMFYSLGRDDNMREFRMILGSMGLEVNKVFLDICTMDDVIQYPEAEFGIQLGRSKFNREVCRKITERTGMMHVEVDIPIGLAESLEWVDVICDSTGRSHMKTDAKMALRERYWSLMEPIRRRTEGKRVMIYYFSHSDLDWHLETLSAIGVEVVHVTFVKGNVIDHNEKVTDCGDIPVTRDGTFCGFKEEVERLKPDLIITNDHNRVSSIGVPWCGMNAWTMGIGGAVEWAQKVEDSFDLPTGRGWEGGL